MSHNKTNPVIHVPFSWEKMPGLPKCMAEDSPKCVLIPGGVSRNNLEEAVLRKKTLPLPPGSFQQPLRSVSKRMLSYEEDPFIAALVKCSKDSDNYKGKDDMKKSFGSRVWTSKSFLSSCKHSFDVQESHLPSSFVVRANIKVLFDRQSSDGITQVMFVGSCEEMNEELLAKYEELKQEIRTKHKEIETKKTKNLNEKEIKTQHEEMEAKTYLPHLDI
ncbi:hypothetical protein LXL04_024413 [Taraxacum kok-saghyz]